jgi:hypothetical protein
VNPLKALPSEILAKRFVRAGVDVKLSALGVGLRDSRNVSESPEERAERYARQQAKRKKTLERIKTDRLARRAAIRRRKARRQRDLSHEKHELHEKVAA